MSQKTGETPTKFSSRITLDFQSAAPLQVAHGLKARCVLAPSNNAVGLTPRSLCGQRRAHLLNRIADLLAVAQQAPPQQIHTIIAVVGGHIRQSIDRHAAAGTWQDGRTQPIWVTTGCDDFGTFILGKAKAPAEIRKDGYVGPGETHQLAKQHAVPITVIGRQNIGAKMAWVRHDRQIKIRILRQPVHCVKSEEPGDQQDAMRTGVLCRKGEVAYLIAMPTDIREIKGAGDIAPLCTFGICLRDRCGAPRNALFERGGVLIGQPVVLFDDVRARNGCEVTQTGQCFSG
mmetsp:Transcript_5455/g.8658  ORF Transcript_5455/g.8658 Transcript_5455/m.8658 type:complete len:288 (+) Transcript_5455:406-1269(+)